MSDQDKAEAAIDILADVALSVRLDERTPIRIQGVHGTCSECAVVSAAEHVMLGHPTFTEKERVNLSPRFLTWAVAKRRGDASPGATVREAAMALALEGVPTEELCDYSNFGEPPSDEAKADAVARIGLFYITPIRSKGFDLIRDIQRELDADRKVPFGFAHDSSFLNYWKGDPDHVFEPPRVSTGNHAALIVGQKSGKFLIQSSWGPDWGFGGYAWISYAYAMAWGTDDFTRIEFGW